MTSTSFSPLDFAISVVIPCIEADIEGISKPFGMIIWFSLDITFPSQSETIHASWTNLGQLSSLELGAL